MSQFPPRRTGVMTVVCPSCLTLNGVKLPAQHYDTQVAYECYHCACFSRATVHQEMIRIHPNQSIQRGVKVYGKG